MADAAVLVVAAGRSVRFGDPLPKQYHDIGGRAVLWHSIAAFHAHPDVDRVAVVINPDNRALYDAAVAGLDGLEPPVAGGDSRQESVWRGLEALAADRPPARVLIHDGARPLIDADTIRRTIAALEDLPAAIAAVPVRDTLKRAAPADPAADSGPASGSGPARIGDTVDRTGLWRAQTPQGFRFEAILAAHRQARAAGMAHAHTDDAAVAEAAGLCVGLVEGHEDNLKVTTQDDLERARRRAGAGPVFRVGTGFDVHRIGPGDGMCLCGIRVPADGSLIGHSDADVGLHAITDAILGALGDGDIGQHFPDTDPRWQGAASDRFLAHARDLVRRRGGGIANVDVTLICERPKIGPHRQAMVARIAEILDLPAGAVNVKATTTERLGFTGRGEGIAAEAVACLRLPAACGRSDGAGPW